MTEFTCKIKDSKEDKNAFLVVLLDVPEFPNEKPLDDIVRKPLQAVIAATDNDEPRSFIGLNNDEKHCIGDALQALNVKSGEWKYCELFEA